MAVPNPMAAFQWLQPPKMDYPPVLMSCAIDLLDTTFVDPISPKHCCYGIIGAIYVLVDPNLAQTLRTERPQIFRNAMAFITCDITEERFHSLAIKMNICTCPYDHNVVDSPLSQLHTKARKELDAKYTSTPQTLLRHCFRLVVGLVNKVVQRVMDEGVLHKVEANQRKASRKGLENVPWPATPRDLMPWGLEATMAALGKTVSRVANCDTVGFLAAIMDIVRDPSVHLFLESPTLPGDAVRVGLASLSSWDATHDRLRLLVELKGFALLFRVIGANATPRQLLKFNNQTRDQCGPRDALDFCNRSLEALDALQPVPPGVVLPFTGCTLDGDWNYCRIYITCFATELHYHLGCAHDPSKYIPSILMGSQEKTAIEKNDARLVFHELFRMQGRQACSGPGCSETFISAERRFRTCAGCLMFSYCSKTCQEASWRFPPAPHKSACKAIARITETSGICWKTVQEPKNQSFWTLSFHIVCLLKGVQRDDLAVVANYLRYMRANPPMFVPFCGFIVVVGYLCSFQFRRIQQRSITS